MEEEKNFSDKIEAIKSKLGSKRAKLFNFNLLERVGKKLIPLSAECQECKEYLEDILATVDEIDRSTGVMDKAELMAYHRRLKGIVSHMHNRHKFVEEGYYMTIYMSLGIAFGSALGVLLGNVALGIPIGLCMGIAIGTGIDGSTRKKGLTL